MDSRERSLLGLLLLVASFSPGMAIDSSCVELGYTSNLMCSSCRELREFNLQDLEGECNKCCQNDGVVEGGDDKVYCSNSEPNKVCILIKTYLGQTEFVF